MAERTDAQRAYERAMRRRYLETLSCPQCGKRFTQATTRQRFCCRNCRVNHDRDVKRGGPEWRRGTCEFCGREFERNRRATRFCSRSCYDRNYYRLHKEKCNAYSRAYSAMKRAAAEKEAGNDRGRD